MAASLNSNASPGISVTVYLPQASSALPIKIHLTKVFFSFFLSYFSTIIVHVHVHVDAVPLIMIIIYTGQVDSDTDLYTDLP